MLRLNTVALAMDSYHKHFGEWPRSLDLLTNNSAGIVFVDGVDDFKDAWGRAIHLVPFSEDLGYGVLESYGPTVVTRKTQEHTPYEVRFGLDMAGQRRQLQR